MALIVLSRPLMRAALSSTRGDARLALRTVRTELACARTLLDELETVIDAQNEQTRCDVVLQVAEQIARVASTLIQTGAQRGEEGVVRGAVLIMGSSSPQEDETSESTSAIKGGFARDSASSGSFGHNEGDIKK